MLQQVHTTSALSSIRLEPAESVNIDHVNGNWMISQGTFRISFRLAPGVTSEMLEEIRRGGMFMDKLAASGYSTEAGGMPAEQIGRLWHQGLLLKAVYDGDDRVAVLHNYGEAELLPEPPALSDRIVMTEDACLHREGGKLLVESASCGAYLAIMSERLARVPFPLLTPTQCRKWAEETMLSEEVILALASCLESMGAIRRIGSQLPLTEPSGWSFIDRMFHARSRLGRHVGEYGRKSPAQAAPAAAASAAAATCSRRKIDLPHPDMSIIATHDRSFSEILEMRRSIREHVDPPLSMAKLSEFLYRSARVTGRLGTRADEVTFRPYPSGGGLHELEIYPLIHRCKDLQPGLYRYDPYVHCLEEIARSCPETARLLADARRSSRMTSEPHVLLLMTARFARVNTKYQSVAYSLILKNLGGLFQTMYLVATAMNLAACALGGGNSDVFCRVAGTEFWQESTVGEFLLGERVAECQAQH